jgi:adenylosuccinate synthase
MKIFAVIGCSFGDEGKGMWVDQLTQSAKRPLVIRANGGAQVGHTVYRGDDRFVFSHLGSGSLSGAPTLFTRDAIVNPMLYLKEVEGRNKSNKICKTVFIDPQCKVTTPWDMLLNQAKEYRRLDKRHGSVGVGIGVTCERDAAGVSFHYNDLMYNVEDGLYSKLAEVRLWCLTQLGHQKHDDPPTVANIYSYFQDDDMFDRFYEDCNRFALLTASTIETDLMLYDTLIFENGQGLLLDQEYGSFPHVTRSNTGFHNVGKFLKRNGLFDKKIEVHYISRCYTTRHGAGPLPYERHNLFEFDIIDMTNKPNEFQGSLRFAPLNLQAIDKAIQWDSDVHPPLTTTSRVVTCVDQIRDDVSTIPYINTEGRLQWVEKEQFMRVLDNYFKYIVDSPQGHRIK